MNTNALRFAGYYSAFYITLGAFLPYFPIWLAGRGLSAEWIGWIAAAGLVGRTLVSPLGARWAERARTRRFPILIFAAIAAAALALHLPVRMPLLLAVLAFVAGAALYGQIPLIDSFALHQSRERKITFGPVRAFGSGAFIIANFAAGALIDQVGTESVIVWIVIGAGLIGLMAALLPEGPQTPSIEDGRTGLVQLGRLLAGPFGLVLAASTLIQGSHGFYYVFSAASWSEQGYSKLTIGALWSVGVGIEIVFLWLSGRGRLAKLGPGILLAMGGAGAVLRWGLTALSPPLWGLVLLQLLHALTFAATYIGFLRYVSRSVPDRQATTAQAINSALSGGVVLALASAVSGYLFDQVGAMGFAAMIVPAALGMIAAIRFHRVCALPHDKKID